MDVDPELAEVLRAASDRRIEDQVHQAAIRRGEAQLLRKVFADRRTVAKQLLHAAKLERNRESA